MNVTWLVGGDGLGSPARKSLLCEGGIGPESCSNLYPPTCMFWFFFYFFYEFISQGEVRESLTGSDVSAR